MENLRTGNDAYVSLYSALSHIILLVMSVEFYRREIEIITKVYVCYMPFSVDNLINHYLCYEIFTLVFVIELINSEFSEEYY